MDDRWSISSYCPSDEISDKKGKHNISRARELENLMMIVLLSAPWRNFWPSLKTFSECSNSLPYLDFDITICSFPPVDVLLIVVAHTHLRTYHIFLLIKHLSMAAGGSWPGKSKVSYHCKKMRRCPLRSILQGGAAQWPKDWTNVKRSELHASQFWHFQAPQKDDATRVEFLPGIKLTFCASKPFERVVVKLFQELGPLKVRLLSIYRCFYGIARQTDLLNKAWFNYDLYGRVGHKARTQSYVLFQRPPLGSQWLIITAPAT